MIGSNAATAQCRGPAGRPDWWCWSCSPNRAEEPALALRLGRQQGRPLRRYVLADVVRTDRRRLTPLTRVHPGTIALRSSVRARRDLVEPASRGGQPAPRAPAGRVPRCRGPLRDLDSADHSGVPGALHHSEQGELAHPAGWRALAEPKSATPASIAPEVLHAAAARRATRHHRVPTPKRTRSTTRGVAGGAAHLNTRSTALEPTTIAEQLEIHPDAHIVTNRCPESGTLRAARLLAEIGDARGRFPTAEALACLAGVAPSTRQSGKVKAVTFRWVRRQTAPRRPVRLRRRLPPSQSLGRRSLPASPRPRTRPSPRRANPRPSLGKRHLALLARRASPTNQPATAPSNESSTSTRRKAPEQE